MWTCERIMVLMLLLEIYNKVSVIIVANPSWAWASAEWSGLEMGSTVQQGQSNLSLSFWLMKVCPS